MSEVEKTNLAASVDITGWKVSASTNSRILSSFDALGGNLFDLLNTKLERANKRHRAQTDGEVLVVEASAKAAIDLLGLDPAMAQRAADSFLKRIYKGQENKEQVLLAAYEKLEASEEAIEPGPDSLDDAFLGRFESYAEGASTDELVEKWAKVLAGEIRKPGTFSPKLLRLLDEIDPDVARLFDEVNLSRIGGIVPKSICRPLNFNEIRNLVDAGLLVDPGLTGHEHRLENANGTLILELTEYALMAKGNDPAFIALGNDPLVLLNASGSPAIPVYLLTAEGAALGSLVPNMISASRRTMQQIYPRLPHGTLAMLLHKGVQVTPHSDPDFFAPSAS